MAKLVRIQNSRRPIVSVVESLGHKKHLRVLLELGQTQRMVVSVQGCLSPEFGHSDECAVCWLLLRWVKLLAAFLASYGWHASGFSALKRSIFRSEINFYFYYWITYYLIRKFGLLICPYDNWLQTRDSLLQTLDNSFYCFHS